MEIIYERIEILPNVKNGHLSFHLHIISLNQGIPDNLFYV